MSRVYLRLSPELVRNLESKGYTDSQIAGFVRLLCEAGHVDPRGRFRNARILRALMGRQAGLVRMFIERGDIIANPDGSLYVEGWDEWQEGDVTVAERARRIRARRNAVRNGVDRYGSVDGVRVDETRRDEDVDLERPPSRRPLAETLEQIRRRVEPQ